MLRKGGNSYLLDDGDDSDPTASLVNMVDIMLVLAVGFLILAVTATGVMDMNTDHNNQQSTPQSMVDVQEGKEVPNTIEQGDSSGSGYSQVGVVYKDPETGKLVMVDN